MKWYTFNDGGSTSDTIDMILDHNTTALVEWNSIDNNLNGPNEVLAKLKTDTDSWAGVQTRSDNYSISNGSANYTIDYSTYKARLITANEVASITSNIAFNELTSTTSMYFYFETNTSTSPSPFGNTFAWMYNYTNTCTLYGCDVSDTTTYGYWTATATYQNAGNAWYVDHYARLISGNVDVNIYDGIRPVITISKSALK